MAVAVLAILFAGLAAQAGALSPTVLDPDSGCGPVLDQVGTTDCQAPTIAAYGGWTAWSRSDPATGDFELVLRSPAGTIAPAPVPERVSPFDVELGPSGSGVAAVYSRCTNTVTLQGCGIYELPLGVPAAGETALAVPGGGSVHEPAIWGNRIVFLRRNPGGGSEDIYYKTGPRPDSLLTWEIGSSWLQTLTLPASRGVENATTEWPRGLTGVVAGLTLRGKRLAYTTTVGAGAFGLSSLWSQQLGHAPVLIDQITAGEGNVCLPQFISPAFAGDWLYAYLHACDPSANPDLDRWTRYSLTGHRAQRAELALIEHGDEEIFSVVPDGGSVDWDDGEVLRLENVAWRTIRRPVPQTPCSRADPFC
jgi:hypothetical protein